MAVGGLLSSVNRWNAFVPAWRDHLREYGLDYLHIKELHAFRGRYGRFKENRALRDVFMAESIETILKFCSCSIARKMHKQDYETANTRWKLKESGTNMFCLCGISCVIASKEYADKQEQQAEYIFHKGDEGFGTMQRLAGTFTNQPIPRQNRDCDGQKGVVQLQASDLITYEIALECLRNEGAAWQSWRKSFQSLARIGRDWQTLTQKDVDDLCCRFGVSER